MGLHRRVSRGTADWERWTSGAASAASSRVQGSGRQAAFARPLPRGLALAALLYRRGIAFLHQASRLSRKGRVSRRHLSRLRQVLLPRLLDGFIVDLARYSPGVFRHGGGLLRARGFSRQIWSDFIAEPRGETGALRFRRHRCGRYENSSSRKGV